MDAAGGAQRGRMRLLSWWVLIGLVVAGVLAMHVLAAPDGPAGHSMAPGGAMSAMPPAGRDPMLIGAGHNPAAVELADSIAASQTAEIAQLRFLLQGT